MAFPEKISFPDKINRRPVTDPDGQFSANEANEIRDKINKNALFYDVHDDLAALQNKFPNPPVGAFAYLRDGSCYRCVNLGWTTDPVTGGGGGVSYFKGYYTSEAAVRTAYPDGQPGWRVVVRVTGGNDKEGLWDEDDQDWFFFDFSTSISKTYVDDGDAATLQAAKDHANSILNSGTTSPTLHSFYAAHQQNLDYRVTGYFSFPDATFGSKQNPVVQNLTLSPGDATYDRIDMIVANDQGNFEVIEGVPSENPEEPSIDLDTQIRGTIIFVGANATTPENQTATTVFAEGNAGEFNTSAPTGAARLNLASANTPISGTISIEGTNNEYNDTVRFTPDAPITRETFEAFTGFSYKIKNKTAVATPDYPTHRIQIYGKKSNGLNVIAYLEEVDLYGYDSEILNTQKIAVPFSMPGNMVEISYINFKVLQTDDPWGFWLDDVQLIGGEEAPITGDYVTRTEMQAAIAKAKTEMEAYHNANNGAVAPIPITTSRNLAASDNGKKLLIEANVTLTYPAAGLGSNFEFNAVCGAAGTLTLDDENTGADLDGGTFLAEGEIGHAFYWPSTGKLTTKGDWQ